MKIWTADRAKRGKVPPFLDDKDFYKTIDATPLVDIPWQSFVMSYKGEIPQEGEVSSWMTTKHTVWFHDPCLLVHNILSNPDFKDAFDTSVYQEYDTDGNHQYCNFMLGNWSWYHSIDLSLISCGIGAGQWSLGHHH